MKPGRQLSRCLFVLLVFPSLCRSSLLSAAIIDRDDTNAATRDIRKKKPHILFVIMDDLGSHDLGMHGSGIQTPACDKLARDGIFLGNYYVLPSCSPTRTAILSGRYPLHTGINNFIPQKSVAGLGLGEETLPDILKRAGYKRHAIGKWHAGMARWEQTPTFRGFQSFFGFYSGGQDYFNHNDYGAVYDMHYDAGERCGGGCSESIDERGNYSTHVFVREAIRVVEDYDVADGDDHPLFLYLAFQAVHAPDEVPGYYRDKYNNRTEWTEIRKTYAGMLTAADEGIANVTAAMKARGLWEDTLVVFTTDNGGPTETCAVQGSSNHPLRGGKCSIWQGGTTGDGFLSGPFLSKLVGVPKIESDDEKPRTMPHLFHAVDWLPTLAAVAGVKPSGRKPLDGINQLPALRGGKSAPVREELFIGITDSQIGVHGPAMRYKKWKIIEGPTGGLPGKWPEGVGTTASHNDDNNDTDNNTTPYLLFDLETDPEERNDLSKNVSFSRILEMMKQRLNDYKRTGIPQQKDHDPSCPWEGWPTDPTFGSVAVPWCHGAKDVVFYRDRL